MAKTKEKLHKKNTDKKEDKLSNKEKDRGKKPKQSFKESVLVAKEFLKDCWNELKKIQWPTPRQAALRSLLVLVTVLIIIGITLLFDWVTTKLLSFIIT